MSATPRTDVLHRILAAFQELQATVADGLTPEVAQRLESVVASRSAEIRRLQEAQLQLQQLSQGGDEATGWA